MSDTTRHVFVYGTLRRGEQRDINRLKPAPRWVGNASIAGELYDLGTYPGLKWGGSKRVVGEVYRIGTRLEHQLDEIEEVDRGLDVEYEKGERVVQLDAVTNTPDCNGNEISCLVYEATPFALTGRALIAGGDWVAYRLGATS